MSKAKPKMSTGEKAAGENVEGEAHVSEKMTAAKIVGGGKSVKCGHLKAKTDCSQKCRGRRPKCRKQKKRKENLNTTAAETVEGGAVKGEAQNVEGEAQTLSTAK